MPVAVINVMGRVFMTAIDDPFRVAHEEIERVRGEARVILVDLHAEATSEKVALGWYLDGRVTVVVGTHTHVQTADERVLPDGTAYITDVGMTGPHDSVIGVERSAVVQRFLTALPQRFETATENPRLNAVLVNADETTGPRDVDQPSQPVGARHRDAGRATHGAALVNGRPVRSAVRRAAAAGHAGPLTVSDLTANLKHLIEGAFGFLTVVGEISNCKAWSSGHVYFTLKDDYAQIRAVMFRTKARVLKFQPEDGLRVVVRGRLSVYEVKGEYQLVCETMEPQGLGALQAAFEQLKRRLQAEGLFAAERKRPLPVLPRRIGIVTSADGAALRDILRVLTTRHPSARDRDSPGARAGRGRVGRSRARAHGHWPRAGRGRRHHRPRRRLDRGSLGVQRRAAGARDCGVSRARDFRRRPRGGLHDRGLRRRRPRGDAVERGRARRRSRGQLLHAHRSRGRAAPDRDAPRRRAARGGARPRRTRGCATGRSPSSMRDRDREQLGLRLTHAINGRLARERQRFDGLRRRLERRDVHHVAAQLRTRIVAAEERLRELVTARRLAADARARELAGRLDALSPLGVLARGYAVCWNEARTSIIRSARAVKPGDGVRVTLANGELACRVEQAE